MRTNDRLGGSTPPLPVAAETGTSRLRRAWRAAHAPVAGVPRWALVAAYAVPLVVLPSGLWRLPVAFAGEATFGGRVYVVFLSVISELLAFTAVGLAAGWGERFPRWMPGLRGRRVPTPAAVIPATIGAVALTALWTYAVEGVLRGVTLTGEPLPPEFPTQGGIWEAVIFYVCYLPLLLWGPLLAAVTYAYYQRRRRGGRAIERRSGSGSPGGLGNREQRGHRKEGTALMEWTALM